MEGVRVESSVMVVGLLAGVCRDASQIALLSCVRVNGGDASLSEEGGELICDGFRCTSKETSDERGRRNDEFIAAVHM